MLINGRLCASSTGEWIESINPATGQVCGQFPAASFDDAKAAVDASENSWQAWYARGIDARASAVVALASALEAHREELAQLESMDSGNTIGKVREDITKTTRNLRHFAEIAYEAQGRTIPGDGRHLHLTIREPFGTVVRIVPFNHPIMFAASKIAAPLMAGNSVVVKAPEQASLSVCFLAELCEHIFPPGVVNVVTGHGAVAGDALVRDPRVRRVAFTGSVATGQAIMQAAGSSSIKHLSLELGGKNPLIVLEDADATTAADAAIKGMNFAWQGQSCGSTSRLLVHSKHYDAIVKLVADKAQKVRVGDPLDDDSQMGPLITDLQLRRVEGFVARAVDQGARLVAGGRRPVGDRYLGGNWYLPTILADVHEESELFNSEVFGPVLAITPFDSPDEAIRLANKVPFGLAASIWTNSLPDAMRLASRIRSGYVWINEVGTRPKGTPFGGFGDSGIGREEGLEEILSYSSIKTVHVNFGGAK